MHVFSYLFIFLHNWIFILNIFLISATLQQVKFLVPGMGYII